jgi:predicted N-acetyltransferase YhbS
MTEHTYTIVPEQERHQGGVRALLAKAFGPTRMQRAIYRLREGVPPDPALCFVMVNSGGQVLGVVRNYRVKIGDYPKAALLLGPIAVAHSHEKMGLAAQLIRQSIAAAKDRGFEVIYLVGDPNYYAEFGFLATTGVQVEIANLERGKIILAHELVKDGAYQYSGVMQKDDTVVLDQLADWYQK